MIKTSTRERRRRLPERVRNTSAPKDSELQYKQGIAFLRLYRALEGSPGRVRRLKSLTEELELGERRIRRFVKAISRSALGDGEKPLISIESSGDGGSAWVRLLRDEPWSVQANIYQYAVLWATGRWLSAGNRSVFVDTANGVLDQLRAKLSGAATDMVARVPTAFHYQPFGPKDYRDSDILDAVTTAILQRRPIVAEWASRSGVVKQAEIEPYTVVMYRDGLYLYGRFLESGREPMRLLSLERLTEVELDKSRRFDVPEDYDPHSVFSERLGLWQPTERAVNVSLAFTPRAAKIVATRRWPGFVRWSDRKDGRRVLTMKLAPTVELLSWIVSWGPQVEVLAPKSLRQNVISELRAALELYEPPNA